MDLSHWNAPTLTSPELDVEALGVDDQLVLRDVKARLFERDVPVNVGRYPIERKIGRGGMGTVYEALDPELGRRVALKVMLPGQTNAARTKAEARTLAKLSHPNVVTVHEVGQHAERVFLAMEYVDGQTLGKWLSGTPSVEQILAVFKQAGEGLAAAHEAGISHRDFKPTNVLIRDDGHVKVIDFGLSRAALGEGSLEPDADVRLTRTGAMLGTPAYMSPEQFRGDPVDARTDVFSFGVVLYEALTGQRPFAGEDVESLREAVMDGERPSTRHPRIPSRLWAPLSEALRANVDRRPPSLRPLLEALEHRRRRRWFPAAAAGLIVAGGLGAATFWDGEPAAAAAVVEPRVSQDDPVRDPERVAAFVGLRDAPSATVRESAARAFLERYGDDATSAEKLVAEAAIGLSLRERACTSGLDGLCVRRVQHDDDEGRCPQAPAVTLAPVSRNAELMKEADEHLQTARHLMSFQQPPEDEADTKAYYLAVSQVKLATADDELETLLAMKVPSGLEFDDESRHELERSALQNLLTNSGNLGKRLLSTYATLKPGDPQNVLKAAARTALVQLSVLWLLAEVPTPASSSDEERAMYCRVMSSQWDPPVKAARDAIAYCRDNAAKHDLDGTLCNLAPDGFPRVIP
jgi:serine/threonine protein kinase